MWNLIWSEEKNIYNKLGEGRREEEYMEKIIKIGISV